MKRTERLALEELSVKAYGRKTHYKKIMERGLRSELTDETGRKYNGYQRFDLEEIQAVMEEEIADKEERAKKQAEEKAKAEQEKLSAGSTVTENTVTG